MPGRRNSIAMVALAVLVIGVFAVASLADPVTPVPDSQSIMALSSTRDCSTVTEAELPDDVPLNTVLDVSTRTFQLEWFDTQTRENGGLRVDSDDPVCQNHSRIGPLLRSELANWETGILPGMCASLRQAIAEGGSRDPNRTLNLVGAQDYVNQTCASRGL